MTDIVVYGRGKTGQSLNKMLQKQGRQAVFYDDVTGFDGEASFTENCLVLLSPGVKPSSKGIIEAKKVGAKVVSELEFCFPYCLGQCISVTGTNGKTTTCEMISHLLKKTNVSHYLLGNGGIPLSDKVLEVNAGDVVVLESSSFQLNGVTNFAPYISVFTSLACDHIDYHGCYEEYVRAKANNFVGMRQGYAIFNFDDDNVVELSQQCRCKRLYYSVSNPRADCYYDGENITVKLDDLQVKHECRKLRDYAKHNLSNALAAILSAYLIGVPLKSLAKAIADYRLLPHRMETVATVNGVTFVDDSKATNVHATVSALQNYTQPLALILGGSDKEECFDGIFSHLSDNVVAVTASGDTACKIASCGKRYGVEVRIFDDIKAATEYCYATVKKCGQGVVLMSNACASFDKFNGYAERGEYFQRVVKGLNCGKKTN